MAVAMNIYGNILPGASYLASLTQRVDISKEADKRLKWFDYYLERGKGNARLTCCHFDISPRLFIAGRKGLILVI